VNSVSISQKVFERWCFSSGESGKRLLNHDGGKECGVSGVSVMKKRKRIADSGVSATEESQKC
jgi:hypothetical protein